MLHLKQTITFIFLILGIQLFSQNIYKPGYYIQNDGKSVNCLIQESDLTLTPEIFNYKISASSPIKKMLTDSVKEVNITDGIRYKWADIPDQNRSLFLNVLVSGKAILYKQNERNSTVYFFQVKDSAAKVLPQPDPNKQQQDYIAILKSSLLCEGLIDADFSNLTYTDNKLITLFIRYNVCKQSSYVKIEPKREYDFFNLYIKPGFSYQSLTVDMPYTVDFGSKPLLRIGVEFEFNMNIIKNRTALIIDPCYNYFFAEKYKNTLYYKIHYTSIEVPFGIRQYLSLSPKSEVFANVSYLADFGFNSEISRSYSEDAAGISNDLNNVIFSYNFGAGYCWDKRLTVELRYNMQKELFPKEIYWQTDLSGFSLIVGYNLFK